MFLIEMNDFDFRAVLWSGVFYHEGHYVSFKINKDETVFVKEVLEKANSTHKTSKYMTVDEALEYQQRLLNYGYDEIA